MVGAIIAIVTLVFFIMILAIINKRRNEKKEIQYTDLAQRYQLELLKSRSFLKGIQFELKGEYANLPLRVHEETTGSGKNQMRFTIWTIKCAELGFKFSIAKENFLTRIGNWLGFKDIEFRDEKIDDAFRFKSDNEERFKAIMTSNLLYELGQMKDEINGIILYEKGSLTYRMQLELISDKKKADFEKVLPFLINIIKSRSFH